jgi:hypothetical protein
MTRLAHKEAMGKNWPGVWFLGKEAGSVMILI